MADQTWAGVSWQDEFRDFIAGMRELRQQMAETDRRMAETDRQMKETDRRMAETDRQMKETDRRIAETDIQIKETDLQMKETARRMKETDRMIGELGNRFGELAEHLVAPSIREKFNERGCHFDDVSRNREINGPDGRWAEIDILLENEEISIVVEVKARPTEKHVDQHIRRIEVVRQHKDKHHDRRKIQGAVAGAIMTKAVRDYAWRAGFYVIEQTGDTVRIDTPPDFKPREW
jgi:chromosome segregation ATPase